MFSFVNARIRNKIIALPVCIVGAISIFMIAYFPQNKRTELMSLTADQITVAADLLAFGFGVALGGDNFAAIGEGFALAKNVKGLSYIIIFDSRKNFLSAWTASSAVKIDSTRKTFAEKPIRCGPFMEKASPIRFQGQGYGTVVVGISLKSTEDRTRQSVLIMLLTALIGIAIAVIVSAAVSAKIVKPLNEVRKAMGALGRCNLTEKCIVSSSDETAAMAGDVNTAIDSLRSSMLSVSSGAESISHAAEQLSGISREMAASAEDVARRSRVAAATVDEATETVASMSSSADEMSGSIRTVAAAIEEMSVSLNEVARNCQKESTIAMEATKQATKASEVMGELGKAAEEVSKIVEVISDIADQTNLLALNATIEAASAGDAGRGFAVVAQEVKELSRQTAGATESITRQITTMQQRTAVAIKGIDEIAKVIENINEISHIIASAVEEQSATVNEIAHTSGTTSNNAGIISRNVTEFASGLGLVSQNVSGVDAEAAKTVGGTERIRGSSEDLTQLAEQLRNIVKTFRI